ncbi:MAG: glycosyltransferase family 39 protein [Candidatus Obscuribacterales bacterium]|nr:glycosyltransferase family 39 protein [Candidatus Obscuribacterales bacterium]
MPFILVLILIGLMTYLPWLGSFGPLDPTDSFFLESGREIIETGNYLLPLMNYEPWLDKPIFFFWLVVLSYKLGGITPFFGRLPAALSAIALSLVLFVAIRKKAGDKIAFLAALIFLANPLTSIIGHLCLTDMTLSLCIAGCILYLHRSLHSKNKLDLVWGYLALGLGLFCKGPIAAIICGLSLLAYIVIRRRNFKEILKDLFALHPLAGLSLALAINLPWYLAANAATAGEFFQAFFLTQNFGRMVGKVNHQEPFWFYIPVFFGGLFPWSLIFLTPSGLFKNVLKKPHPEEKVDLDLYRLCLCWFSVVIILFTIIKTKLPTYILPAVPAFAIMLALQIKTLTDEGKLKRLLWTGILSAVGIGCVIALHNRFPSYIGIMIENNLFVLPIMLAALCLYSFALLKSKNKLALSALCLAALIGCGIFVPQGIRAYYGHKQIGFNSLVLLAKQQNANLAIFSAEEPSIPWVLHKPVPRIREEAQALNFMKSAGSPKQLLAPQEMLKDLGWFKAERKIIASRGKWQLIELSPKIIN